jgi:hypothetical protein
MYTVRMERGLVESALYLFAGFCGSGVENLLFFVTILLAFVIIKRRWTLASLSL